MLLKVLNPIQFRIQFSSESSLESFTTYTSSEHSTKENKPNHYRLSETNLYGMLYPTTGVAPSDVRKHVAKRGY